MKVDRFKAVRKKTLRIAIDQGLPQAVYYMRSQGIRPTKHMITEIKLVATVYKQQYAS